MLELLTVLKIINRHNILYEVYGDLMKTFFLYFSLQISERFRILFGNVYHVVFVAMMSSYLTAVRPWTLSVSLAPVLLGSALSYKTYGQFSIILAILSTITVLAVHGAGNLVNTYFDYIQGVDARAEGTEDRTLVDHHLEPAQVVNLAAYLYGCGMLGLWALMIFSPARSELIAGLFFGGLSGSFLYTGGIGLKYYIMGDLVVIITFGPLAVLFSYFVQSGHFSLSPLLLAIPLALNTEAIMHSKHTRDINAHRQTGLVSLAVLLGQQGSYLLLSLLLFFPYFIFLYWMLQYSLPLGLPIITIPYAFKLERTFRESDGHQSISQGLAQLNLTIGLLQIISCIFSPVIPFTAV